MAPINHKSAHSKLCLFQEFTSPDRLTGLFFPTDHHPVEPVLWTEKDKTREKEDGDLLKGHSDIIHTGGGDMVLSQHTARGAGSVSPAMTHWGMTQAGAMTVTVMGQVSRIGMGGVWVR